MPNEPKTLRLFRRALDAGYMVDPETALAYRPDGSIWAPFLSEEGYPTLQLNVRSLGGHFTIRLHKAVAYVAWGNGVFGGPNIHVRHLSGVKTNCCIKNLALGTARDNNLDKSPEMRIVA